MPFHTAVSYLNFIILGSSRTKHPQTCFSKNTNKQPGIFSPSIWTDNLMQLNSPETQDSLSGSKLKNWMLHSNPEHCSSSLLTQHIVPKNNLSVEDQRLLEMYGKLILWMHYAINSHHEREEKI